MFQREKNVVLAPVSEIIVAPFIEFVMSDFVLKLINPPILFSEKFLTVFQVRSSNTAKGDLEVTHKIRGFFPPHSE